MYSTPLTNSRKRYLFQKLRYRCTSTSQENPGVRRNGKVRAFQFNLIITQNQSNFRHYYSFTLLNCEWRCDHSIISIKNWKYSRNVKAVCQKCIETLRLVTPPEIVIVPNLKGGGHLVINWHFFTIISRVHRSWSQDCRNKIAEKRLITPN